MVGRNWKQVTLISLVALAASACAGEWAGQTPARDGSLDGEVTDDGSSDGASASCGNLVCEESESNCTCPDDCGPCAGCCDGVACMGGDALSACGSGGEVCEACTGGAVCAGGDCVCQSQDHTECYDDHVYWFDSCGNIEGQAEDCGLNGCDSGACRTYTCVDHCRNGSADGMYEVCDDEAFTVTESMMLLVCEDGNNGIGYISTTSGPPCLNEDSCDGVHGNEGNWRCRGWTRCECEDPWAPGNIDYVDSLVCTYAGKFIEVDLSSYMGQRLYFGVHDNPSGGGHMNYVCLTHWN